MIPPDSAAFRIGDWLIDPALDEISRAGKTVKLEPRSMRVLVCLAERPGEVVSVELLLNTVWKDVVVTQDSVYQAIAGLRHALGDDPKEPGYIANVPRRGYRLIALVTRAEQAQVLALRQEPLAAGDAGPGPETATTRAAPPLTTATAGTRRVSRWSIVGGAFIAVALVATGFWWRQWRPMSSAVRPPAASVAVLPFLDLSEHHDQGYFSDGLAEELIDMLAQVQELRVPSHTSSFALAGKSDDIEMIARKLKVSHVLEGSVRRFDDHIRVTAQLIRADDGYHLWSNTYDRDLKDIFEVQDEIAGAVVSALKVRLLPSQHVANSHRTANTQAYMLYLVGRQNYYYSGGDFPDLRHAVGAYREATVLDPQYAAAYAGLAEAMGYSSDVAPESGPVLQEALQAADRAISLAPDLAEGYAARGLLREIWLWDWAGARTDIERALALDPGSAAAHRRHGLLLAQLGQLPQGIAELRKASELDPLVEGTWAYLGFFLTASGQYAASREAFTTGMRIEHGNFIEDAYYRGVNELKDGHVPAARDQFVQSRKPALRDAGIALVEHSLGHRQQSQEALEALIRDHAADEPYTIATVYAWRGDRDRAFEWLDRAYARHHTYLSRVKVDPLLDALHGDPRFGELLRRMGLPG